MRRFKLGILALFVLPAYSQQPLSLAEAARLALERHPSVEARAAEADAAATKVKQVHSNYYPKVSWQESWNRSNNPVFVFSSLLTQRRFTERNFAIGSLNRPDFLNNFQSVLAVDQLLYDAGRTGKEKQAAQLGQEIAGEHARTNAMQVIARVVETYHGVALAAESLKVAEDAVRSAEADLKRAEAVRGAGMATDADVLSIQVHLAAMREQRIARSYDLEVAQSALNEALGLPLETPHQLTTPLTALPPPAGELARYEKQAATERPELRQAEFAARIAATETDAARSGYWPQVSFRAAFEADRQEFVTKGGANWFFGATMRWNLYNGNQTREMVREASHRLRAVRAEQKRADAGVRLEVRRAHADLMAAQERIAVAEAAVAQAEEALRITKNRYEAGLTTVTELLRNETALLETQTRYLAAVYNQRLAAAGLELASGILSVDSAVLQ